MVHHVFCATYCIANFALLGCDIILLYHIILLYYTVRDDIVYAALLYYILLQYIPWLYVTMLYYNVVYSIVYYILFYSIHSFLLYMQFGSLGLG